MEKNILYTSLFQIPTFPNLQFRPPTTSLIQGDEGVFGLGLCPLPEAESLEEAPLACHFLEIDLNRRQVTLFSTEFRCVFLYHMQNGYDKIKRTWIVAIRAGTRKDPDDYIRNKLTLYEVSREKAAPWLKILQVEAPGKGIGETALKHFWQRDQMFPLVFSEHFAGGLSPMHLHWRQWRASGTMDDGTILKLGRGFLAMPYVFDKTFLLFTCDCQRRNSQWRFRIAAYMTNGMRISQKLVPGVALPSLYEYHYFADDLWDWFWPTMHLAPGPSTGKDGKETCVAVLIMHAWPEKSRKWQEGRLAIPEPGFPRTQGGLYWIDQDGHILRRELVPLGEQVNLCLCGEKVVGTDFLDGQRRLWSWSPLQAKEHTIHALLPTDVQRATLISIESNQPKGEVFFWCIEEYAQGLRVSLWENEHFQKLQEDWMEGVALADHATGYAIQREPCIVAYQRTLLIIGITQDRRIQVIQFYSDI